MNWADYQVGRRVVCLVDHSGWRHACSVVPDKGRIYTVRAALIGHNSAGQEMLGLFFQEFVADRIGEFAGQGGEWAFAAHDFRPLEEGRLDQFRQLLTPTPKERVPA